jgi:SPP1 gp7 family putative phage head morphogenesis protein
MPRTRTIPHAEAHQDRLLARADASADAAGAAVLRAWLELLRAIKAGGPWGQVYDSARRSLQALTLVADGVAADLRAAHRDSATWTAERLAATLPLAARTRLLRRRGLLEDATASTELLAGMLLPPLDPAAVNRVVYASGWAQAVQRLTSLAAPDLLAARVASAVARGLTVQQIAAEIRPVVDDFQTSARRVARTAGLWVAHEAERDVYRGLEGDLIAGYTVRAVRDSRTRPEHRKRDGQKFYVRPVAGQRPMSECPHPPREADGSWAFNCRCFLTPILDLG